MSEKTQRGIQSVEVGGRLLLALAAGAPRMPLRELAREAQMDASKAHRYLVSFGKLGFVQQDAMTGNYMLGPTATQLGLAALQRSDPLREATAAAPGLVAQIGHTVAIAAPGHLGPTVVRIEESVHPLHVNMHTGTVMSLLNTATGLVFATWLPRSTITRLLGQEAMRLHGERGARTAAGALLDGATRDVRRHGIARAVGKPIPGINAVSAPIFDFSGQIVLALTALGPAGMFDAAWDGEPARAVRACADQVTRRIGGVRPA
jgi:DNA-binding IclR family transcriptional regulator